MKNLRLLGLLTAFSLGTSLGGAPNLAVPIDELPLTDGTVLREVSLKSYARKGVMVRHAGGFAQIAYEKFPEAYREAVLAKRPAATESAPAASGAGAATTTVVPAVKPAASSRQPQRMTTINGSVLLREGRAQAAAADVEIRVYTAAEFSEWDNNRRRTLLPRHAELRDRMTGKGTMGVATPNEQAEFYDLEFASWDSIPGTPHITRTDAGGSFSLRIPVDESMLVFARTKREVGGGSAAAYHIWAVRVNNPQVVLTNSNTYPILRMAAP